MKKKTRTVTKIDEATLAVARNACGTLLLATCQLGLGKKMEISMTSSPKYTILRQWDW